jgi:hypothetical protein
MVHGQPEYPYFNLTTLHRDDILYSSSRDYEAMWVVLIEPSSVSRSEFEFKDKSHTNRSVSK